MIICTILIWKFDHNYKSSFEESREIHVYKSIIIHFWILELVSIFLQNHKTMLCNFYCWKEVYKFDVQLYIYYSISVLMGAVGNQKSFILGTIYKWLRLNLAFFDLPFFQCFTSWGLKIASKFISDPEEEEMSFMNSPLAAFAIYYASHVCCFTPHHTVQCIKNSPFKHFLFQRML